MCPDAFKIPQVILSGKDETSLNRSNGFFFRRKYNIKKASIGRFHVCSTFWYILYDTSIAGWRCNLIGCSNIYL